MKEQLSEFEVHAVVYTLLKPLFPHVRGEYVVAVGDRQRRASINDAHGHKRRGARVDIAIFDSNKELKLIIEVKRNEGNKAKEQGQRYAIVAGVPVIYIKGIKQAMDCEEIVFSYLKDNNIIIS